MIQEQTFDCYPIFGNNATKIQPDTTKMANGFIPADVYPAEWANWAWYHNSKGLSDLNVGVASMEQELITLLTCAGETPNACCCDQVYGAITHFIEAAAQCKAPNMHASSATIYGVGNASCYGHLKISDTYTSVLTACSGVAASQKAVACVYGIAKEKAAVGNTVGCALGTASAGTATTAARSDHVHPKPTQIDCSCKVYRTMATANTNRNLLIGEASESTGYGCVYVGNSCKATFNPGTGVLTASCFCGTASCASIADKAKCVCIDYFSSEQTGINVMLTNTSIGGCGSVGWSCNERLTFNPSTGVLTASCFCGNAQTADKVCIAKFTRNGERNVMIACTPEVSSPWFSVQGISTNCTFTFNPSNGTVTANCFCGTSSYAVSSCYSCRQQLDHYTENSDLNLLITSGTSGCISCIGVVGSACSLKFNPTTGVLTARCFCGNARCSCWADCGIHSCCLKHLKITDNSSCPVFRTGAHLCNKTGEVIMYFRPAADYQPWIAPQGLTCNILCDYDYYYIQLW